MELNQLHILHQLADENKTRYPEESEIIRNLIYVDVIFTEADTIDQLKTHCNNIDTI